MYNNLMAKPLISIIVPVYNVAPYLGRCFSSLKNQTYKNLEIILIDDGSTDESKKLCELFAKDDSRVVLKRQKNSGLSSARNTGLDLAKGEFVTFLDSDDFLSNDYVEYLYGFVEKNDALISICSQYERKENGELKNYAAGYSSKELTVEEALHEMLNEKGFHVSAWGKLYSRKLFETSPKVRYPVNKVHEDLGTTYKLFLNAFKDSPEKKIPFGAKPKYYYRIRKESISHQEFDPRKLDIIIQTDEMCDRIEELFPELKNTTQLRRMHARFSIIRQAKTARYLDPCIKYVKEHKTWISKNPEATKRDKLALASLSLGKTAFKASWRLYEAFFK